MKNNTNTSANSRGSSYISTSPPLLCCFTPNHQPSTVPPKHVVGLACKTTPYGIELYRVFLYGLSTWCGNCAQLPEWCTEANE